MDWDEDGLNDLIVGENNGKVRYFRNIGTVEDPELTFESYLQANGADIDCGSYSVPCVNDWNEDGNKDLLIGDTGGQFFLFINYGTNSEPRFSQYSMIQLASGSNADVGYRSGPVVADLNEDGLKDLISGDMTGKIYFFPNSGTNAAPVFTQMIALQNGSNVITASGTARVTALDWDADGHLDLIAGGYDAKLRLYLQGTASVPGVDFTIANLGSYLIPAAGGTLRYSVVMDNPSLSMATVFDFWTEVELPNGSTVEVMFRPDVSIPAAGSISRTLQLTVPGTAPSGYYYYYGYCGDYDNLQMFDSGYLYFYKPAGDGEGISIYEWDSYFTDGELCPVMDEVPSSFKLNAPSPNPFNPQTNLTFSLNEAGHVSLAVYDITGREVQSLVSGHLSLGQHEVIWNAEGQGSGVYFARLTAGGETATQKLLLIK